MAFPTVGFGKEGSSLIPVTKGSIICRRVFLCSVLWQKASLCTTETNWKEKIVLMQMLCLTLRDERDSCVMP